MLEIIFGLLIFAVIAIKIFGNDAENEDDTNFYHRTRNDNNDDDGDFGSDDSNDDFGSDDSSDSDSSDSNN